MTVIVKHGDTHDTEWTANADLTGATLLRLLARPKAKQNLPDTVIVLAVTPIDLTIGKVKHTLTGLLEIGEYNVELEVTRSGQITTFPNDCFETLSVRKDLG